MMAGGASYQTLRIDGLRGFASEQSLQLAVPDGRVGSGMTVVVGANNSGKSTIIEALRALSVPQSVSFTRGKRNLNAGDRVRVSLSTTNGASILVESLTPGGSETRHEPPARSTQLFVVPSRRSFNPFFGKTEWKRAEYIVNQGFPALRSSALDTFSYRLFEASKAKAKFDQVLRQVVDPVPDWTIDQEDNGSYFLKIRVEQGHHSSEGLGEGIISVLFIIDALYDSEPGTFIAIDEPELSLHPALQRRLAAVLAKYAADRQIIIATHSPYFVNPSIFENGGTLVRAWLSDRGITLSQLSQEAASGLSRFTADSNNPHVLGLDAREVFFLDDRIVLVEGQEDVIYYARALEDIGTDFKGQFFGWGVGGAEKMGAICAVLASLGYQRVFGLLDSDKIPIRDLLEQQYPEYRFAAIPAPDVRTKPPVDRRPGKRGLLNDKNEAIRTEYAEAFRGIVARANEYLMPPKAEGASHSHESASRSP